MNGKLRSKSLPLLMLVIGMIVSLAISIPAFAAEKTSKHKINENNQTYGIMDLSAEPLSREIPDLVAAVGINGTEGYVYYSDLQGKQPQNPEEALEYMQKLKNEIQIAQRKRSPFVRYIPLYEADGKTIIGQFGISYNETTPES